MQIFDQFWFLLPWLTTLTLQLPFFVLSIVGAVFALSRWQRHPRISLYTTVSIGVSIIWTLVSSFLSVTAPTYIFRSYPSQQSVYYYYAFAIGSISSLIHSAAFGLLLLAIFSDRPRVRQKPPQEF